MPSKGKRVASRQSNLRRRRGNANRSTAPRANAATAATATAVADVPATDTAPGSPVSTGAPADPAPAAAVRARPIRQPQGRRFQRPAAYNHVGSELRRIGIFAGVLVVILVAVSFVLPAIS